MALFSGASNGYGTHSPGGFELGAPDQHPIDNTSLNPARSLSTAIFADGWAFEQLWAFIVFPAVGAVIAAFTWRALTPADKPPPARRKRS